MEIDESCYGDTITKALNVLFERLFVGHGYDNESERADNLAILLENGLLDYINKEQYEILLELITRKYEEWQEDKTYFGYGDWTKETAYLIAVWKIITRIRRKKNHLL